MSTFYYVDQWIIVDKQCSTKHTYRKKDQVTQTSINTGDELRGSRKVSSSCYTSVAVSVHY